MLIRIQLIGNLGAFLSPSAARGGGEEPQGCAGRRIALENDDVDLGLLHQVLLLVGFAAVPLLGPCTECPASYQDRKTVSMSNSLAFFLPLQDASEFLDDPGLNLPNQQYVCPAFSEILIKHTADILESFGVIIPQVGPMMMMTCNLLPPTYLAQQGKARIQHAHQYLVA